MNRRNLIIIVFALLAVSVLVVIGMANQDSAPPQIHPTYYPPAKLTLEAHETEEMLTARAMLTERATQYGTKSPGPRVHPSSCPYPKYTPQPTPMLEIWDYRRDGPQYMRKIINVALALSSEGNYYSIFAGAPVDAPDQGLLIVMYGGNKDARLLSNKDPCAYYWTYTWPKKFTPVAARTSIPDSVTYHFPRGPLTLIKIKGDTVIFIIAGGGKIRFNYVTGEILPQKK